MRIRKPSPPRRPFALRAVLALAAILPWAAEAKLRVAATTTFVGDVVSAIAGASADVTVILPRGADPHEFEPTPRDITKLDGAQVLFANGLGLEDSLRGPLKNVRNGTLEVVEVSRGVSARAEDGVPDPHVWCDPACVAVWTTNIEAALSRLDPGHAAEFRERAGAYRKQLTELDAAIRSQIQAIPENRRTLVTDHDELHYFADRYGLKIAGAILPGFSSLAEPSARELAALEKRIRELNAPAVFAGGEVPAALARRVAADTGVRLIPLPGCALGPEKSDTGTLLGWLRTTAAKICEGLRAP